MKNMFLVLPLLISFLSCNSRNADNYIPHINTNETVIERNTKKNVKSKEFNPSFYLRITGIFTGSTWYDESQECDKVFRVVLYNDEEHITIVIETIAISDESASLTLLKQEKLLEKNLDMPDYSINKVEFVNWLNAKEIKLKINDKSMIIDLKNLNI